MKISNKKPTTHIVSTDRKRKISDVVNDIEAMGMEVMGVLNTGAIFIHVPKKINPFLLKGIKGVVAASPNYEIK